MNLIHKKSNGNANHLVIKCSGLLLLSLFLNLPVMGQSSISGQVTDTTNNPLPYVNVTLKNGKDQDTVDGTTTDKNGHFSFEEEQASDYQLEVSYMGYQTTNLDIDPDQNDDLHISLEESSEQLDEAVVESTKPTIQQKTDRFVFNVDQTASASSGTANDALKKTPGVNVEDDKLEIVGKGEVKVLIDDKMIRLSGEDLHTYLNSIPADNIESIEVISTPPAKYEAEGNSGLINIVLKEAQQDSWSNTVRSNYKQRSYPSFGIGDAFLYHKDKLELSASLDVTKGYRKHINDLKLYFDEGPWREPIHMKNKLDNISGKFNLDYNLTDKATVGVSYHGSFRNSDVSDHMNSQIFDNEGNEQGKIHSSGDTDNPINSHSIGGYYDQKLDTLGRKLSLNVDYFGYENRQDRHTKTLSDYQDQHDSHIENVNNQYIDNYSASLDMEHPTDWAKLSYGGKLLFTKNRNRLHEKIRMDDNDDADTQTDHFKYHEYVQALYADVTKKFGDQWTAKAGLRFENTETKGTSMNEDNFKRSYAKWFPSVFLNYQANANNVFNLSYSRRINRPGFWALNPARWYINSISYTEGNPFLQPKFTDNLELKHIFEHQLTSTFFVSKENKGYNQIPSVDQETNQQIYTVDNFYDLTSYGIREGFEFSPASWWKSTSQATLSYIDGRFMEGFDDLGEFQKGFAFNFYTDHNFFLNEAKTLQLEATYNYNSSKKALMYELGASSSLDLAFKTKFLDKRLQATVAFKDIYKGEQGKITTYTGDVKQVYNNYYDSRSINVSLTYKFGNEDLKSKQHKAKNKDIQERTD